MVAAVDRASTLTSTIGKPASDAAAMASWMPLSTGLMYSFGIAPPMMSFSNSKPLPALVGLDADHDVAVLARPPVCRM